MPQKKPKAARKIHPMPVELIALTEKDVPGFLLARECDLLNKESKGEEFLVAQSYRGIKEDGTELFVDLNKLSSDHLRQLCRNIGVKNVSTLNKFGCRKAMANHFVYQKELVDKGLPPTSQSGRTTSNILRAINVVFSSEYFDDFLKVNDRKSRADHEGQTTNKLFWVNACATYNTIREVDNLPSLGISGLSDSEASFCDALDEMVLLVYPTTDIHLCDLPKDQSINLLMVDSFETEAFRKKILLLFKVRRAMKENMTASGTHDSDPWNFVEVAMKDTTGLTKIAMYYFYMRCEENPAIDASFEPFLDANLKGTSVHIGIEFNEEASIYSSATKKRKQEDAFETMLNHQEALLDEMKNNNKETKRSNNFRDRLEAAKAIGDIDKIKKLLEEAETNA